MKTIVLLALVTVMTLNPISLLAKEAASPETAATTAVVNRELKGIVMDKLTNETLAGVAIHVNGKKIYTDLDGKFAVSNLNRGLCELKVSLISYEEQTLKVHASGDELIKIELSQR